MSRPRYTWRASAEITVIGVSAASATATAVLPTPVGPTMTGVRCLVLGAAEPAFKFFPGKLDHAGAAVDIVRGERRAQESNHELAHLIRVERLPGLDRRATGIRRGEPFEPILPAAEPAPRQIGDQLLQAARRFEAGMRIRRGVHDNAAPREGLDLVADAREQLTMRLDRVELHRREVERQREQQTLRRRTITRELAHHVFVQHALVGGVL